MTVWMHQRKGRIVGIEVPQGEPSEWMFVTIQEDVRGFVTEWEAGETITLRRSSMREVHEPTEPPPERVRRECQHGYEHFCLLCAQPSEREPE